MKKNQASYSFSLDIKNYYWSENFLWYVRLWNTVNKNKSSQDFDVDWEK